MKRVICTLLALVFIMAGTTGCVVTETANSKTKKEAKSDSKTATNGVMNDDRPVKKGFDKATNQTITVAGCQVSVPSYWSAEKNNDNYYLFTAEKGAYVTVSASYREQEITYEQLKEGVSSDSFVEAYQKRFDACGDLVFYPYENGKIKGLECELTFIKDEKNGYLKTMVLQKDGEKFMLTVELLQTYDTEYQYNEDFEEILASVCFVVAADEKKPTETTNEKKESQEITASSTDNTKESSEQSQSTKAQNEVQQSETSETQTETKQTDAVETSAKDETQAPKESAEEQKPVNNDVVDAAKDMLSNHTYSRAMLIEMLQYTGYSYNDAEYGADHCGADWNALAVKSAKTYMKMLPMSRSSLIFQLEYEFFTHEEAVYGADNCGADRKEEAKRSAQSYVDLFNFSRERMIGQLEYDQFTHEEAVYGADNSGADWNAEAKLSAIDYVDMFDFSRERVINQLEYDQFTHDQAVYGADNCGADWNAEALGSAEDYLQYVESYDEMVNWLESDGFTHEQAVYAADQCGI